MGVHLLGRASGAASGDQRLGGWPTRGIRGFDGPGPDGVPRSGVVRVTRVVGQHRRQQLGEPGPAPRAARLHGADGAVEHRGRLGDRVALHVDQHQRRALLGGQLVQRGEHQPRRSSPTARSAGSSVAGVADASEPRSRVLLEVVGQRLGPAYLRRAQPVEAGVDDDPVQPGRDGGVAAEGPGPAVRRDQAVLEPVGGVLAVAHRAQGDRPEPVAVPVEQDAERLGVAGDVGARAARASEGRRVPGCSSADRHLGDLAAEAVRRPSGARSARR